MYVEITNKPLQNEIRIVQASLLGSILANLLLILGMCFLYGGLRFREQVRDQQVNSCTSTEQAQIYNSTVTQMSACLLSLSVTSLLLPVGFQLLIKLSIFTTLLLVVMLRAVSTKKCADRFSRLIHRQRHSRRSGAQSQPRNKRRTLFNHLPYIYILIPLRYCSSYMCSTCYSS